MSQKNGFVCSYCQKTFRKWVGKCTGCGRWNSLKNFDDHKEKDSFQLKTLDQVAKDKASAFETIEIDCDECRSVFGSGLVKGSTVLLTGEPGVGKSTLVLYIVKKTDLKNSSVLYVSGEEALSQVARRAERVGLDLSMVSAIATRRTKEIEILVARTKPSILIIDSIQTISTDADEQAGTVNQIRAVTDKISELSQNHCVATIIIGHVTKDGSIAGPKYLEHMVDGVFNFQNTENSLIKSLVSTKNRNGAIDCSALFTMNMKGIVPYQSVCNSLLNEVLPAPGSLNACVRDSNRIHLLDIEVLCIESSSQSPRRVAKGFDNARFSMLVIVAEKVLNLPLARKDLFLNIRHQGVIRDKDLEFPIIVAILSSVQKLSIPSDIIFKGGVSFMGKIEREKYQNYDELKKYGINKVYSSFTEERKNTGNRKVELRSLRNVSDVLNEKLFKNKGFFSEPIKLSD